MSNRAYLETIECKRTKGGIGQTWIEARIYDDYNTGEIIIPPDNGVDIENDLDILQYCKDYGSDDSAGMCDVIDSILEYQKGITINATFYDWNELKHLFGEQDEV